jgi:hypothetical protein
MQVVYYSLQKKVYGPRAREKKTLCTMQFGNRTFVLWVDAVGTVCIIVPTYSSMPKGGQSGDDERKRRDADTPLVHSSLPEDDFIL